MRTSFLALILSSLTAVVTVVACSSDPSNGAPANDAGPDAQQNPDSAAPDGGSSDAATDAAAASHPFCERLVDNEKTLLDRCCASAADKAALKSTYDGLPSQRSDCNLTFGPGY